VTGGVERPGGAGVGVLVEQPVEGGEGGRVGLSLLPALRRDGQGEADDVALKP
jgi:hypothetical protein